jgi:hypothetical protein
MPVVQCHSCQPPKDNKRVRRCHPRIEVRTQPIQPDSNTPPTPVASGTEANTAVYNGQIGPADVTQTGGGNAYGVFALTGNAFEYEESSWCIGLGNTSGENSRGIRGGSWQFDQGLMTTCCPYNATPSNKRIRNLGFRVGTTFTTGGNGVGEVPEPSSLAIATFFACAVCARKRKRLL